MIVEHNPSLYAPAEIFTLSIIGEGNAFCDTDWNSTVISPPYTRLYYILDGAGELITESGIIPLTAGNLYMLTMGYSFSYRCDDKMQQLFFHINLTNPYGADILQGINRVLSKEVSVADLQMLLSLFRETHISGRGLLKALLLADIFSLLSQNQISIANKQLSDLVQKALTIITQNVSASLTVKEIADSLFVSPVTLSHKFKAEMGTPLGQYIDALVMQHSENLLMNTKLSIAQISDLLGFREQFYFSRRFKQMHGVSPTKYRQQHQLFTEHTVLPR